MEVKIPNDNLFKSDKLQIKDTREIEGKRLLALFMENCTMLERRIEQSEEAKALEEAHDILKKSGADLKLIDKAMRFPWLVCEYFYDFLAESPHVHIIID